MTDKDYWVVSHEVAAYSLTKTSKPSIYIHKSKKLIWFHHDNLKSTLYIYIIEPYTVHYKLLLFAVSPMHVQLFLLI